jgi:predicted Zn-dependent protease
LLVSIHRTLLALLLVASLAVVASAADPPREAPSKEQIARWVRQLGSEDFQAREEASRKLWEAGQAAEEALRVASKDEDTEIRRRSGELLDKFRWGIYPDTPKALVDLVNRYQGADPPTRVTLIRPLLDSGLPGCRILVKIARAEENLENRRLLLVSLFGRELSRVVPMLLHENQQALLEQLLDLGLESDHEYTINHYVAYWLLRDRIDERIAHHKALEGKGDPKQAHILTYLYRARGDGMAALAAARRSGNEKLIDGLLFETAAWKELAFRGHALDGDSRAEQLGHRATFHRLAGNVADARENLEELRKYAANLGKGPDDGQRLTVAKAFLVNERPDDALEVLKAGDDWSFIYDILIARYRFAEAAALVDKAKADGHPDLARLEINHARTLYLLGERDKAQAVFTRYAADIKKGNDAAWFENLVDAEVRVGLFDQAFEHAATVLTVSQRDQGWPNRLLRRLFPRQKETSEALYQHLLASKAAANPAGALKMVRHLLTGKASREEVLKLLGEAGPVLEALKKANPPGGAELDFLAPPRFGSDEAALRWQALAEVASLAGLEEQSQDCLKKADSTASWLDLGDRQAEKKQWEAAARCYKLAWEKDTSQPLPLYLHGRALVHAGKDKDGQEAMSQAHWMPLGDEEARHSFAVDLAKRGQTRESRRENDLIIKVSDVAGWYSAEAVRRNALEALPRKEYFAAADAHERAMLRVLRATTGFLQPSAYLGVPALVHRYRASGLLATGKVAEALEEANISLTLLPSGLDVAIYLIPELDASGKKAEATALYRRVRAIHEQVCKDFPRSPLGHNAVAWLSACCRRDLDDALAHARLAVELGPDNASHLDTLAEVYFQLGQKDRAVGAQKKAVALAPKRAYYRKQLQRFEAGDLKAPRPDENDDDDDED